MIYFPRPYGPQTTRAWQAKQGGRIIDYQTRQGRQRAFLQGWLDSPRNLWLVCGGNGSLALDWADWLATNGPREDAFLLLEIPGGRHNTIQSEHPEKLAAALVKAAE